jgi:large subunit ribosomal protein L9
MDIILLETVENLGNIGDRVKVRSGYGRNFLLPKGKATLATPENIAIFEERRAEFERKEAAELASAQTRADQIKGLTLQLKANTGPEGKLYGSIGTIDIAEACTAAGAIVERSEVRLPDGPIRTIGEHEIEIHLQSDLDVTIRIDVISDGEPPAIIEDEDEAKTDEEVAAGESAQDDTDTE